MSFLEVRQALELDLGHHVWMTKGVSDHANTSCHKKHHSGLLETFLRTGNAHSRSFICKNKDTDQTSFLFS